MRAPDRTALRTLPLAAALVFALAAPAGSGTQAPAAPAPVPVDTLRLTLDDAVQRAAQRGTDARIARARSEAAHGRVHEALSAALPQLSSSVNYQRTFSSIFQGVSADTVFGPLLENSPFAAQNQWNASVTASQVLFSRKVGAAWSAARVYQQASLADEREARAQAALAARRAYHEAAAAGRVADIARETLAQARAHLADVERLYRQGLRAEYDFLRAQVDARNEEPDAIAARNTATLALLQLKRVIDVPAAQPVALVTPLALDDQRVPVVDEDGTAPQRAALESAEQNVTLRKRAVSIETADRWPSLSASATLSQQAFPSDVFPEREQFHRDLTGSLKLELPLFLGGRTSAAVTRARGELAEAQATRDRVRQDVAIELEQARQETHRALAALAARRGTAALARRAYSIAEVRYQGGLSTSLELADARLQLRTSEVNEVQAVRDYLNALDWLEFARGSAPPVHYVPIDQLSSTDIGDSQP